MNNKPIVIAHRGACGYLPEHTFPAKAMAHAMGADFIEQDVVLTRDDRVVVIHDRYLDTTTDVAERYPERRRDDGRYYAIDFTLKEIKSLRVRERFDPETGLPAYPTRFPFDAGVPFEVPTLEEEIEFIQGMNRSTGREAGIYVELKGPAFHRHEGKKIEEIVIDILARYGYASADAKCYIQCFEPESLRYMRETMRCDCRMVQLIGDNSWPETPGVDYHGMMTPQGIEVVAEYAQAIGPWTGHVVKDNDAGAGVVTDLVSRAHRNGLAVHVFTLRADALPSYAKDFDALMNMFFITAGVDGAFTDFPDKTLRYLQERGLR